MSYVSNSYEAYKFMNDKNIIFAYTGTFDHSLITSILKSIKSKLTKLQIEKGLHKKIYSILVESIENVNKHGFVENDRKNSGLFVLCQTDNSYVVITGNHILNEDIPRLQNKLEKVKGLTQEDLRKLYNEQILSERTHPNSAGLGLIDMVMKSGNELQYHFKPLTENKSFYLLRIEINL